jgi:hypothetical protein
MKREGNYWRRLLIVISACVITTICLTPNVFGKFIEDFGHVGAVKIFKGQVRDGDDKPTSGATLSMSNVKTGKSYSIEADENGDFRKSSLPNGKYKVRVEASWSNITEYTVEISNRPKALSKFIIVRLSPGCASGNSGVALVRRRNQRSFQP